jgi:sulfur relay protein TusB/DsrH
MIEMAAKMVEEGKKVAILHIQDSCIATTIDEYCKKMAKAGIDIYVLRTDCQLRGLLGKVREDVKIIDYKEWVRLLMDEHEKIVSWTT